jgi:hypothetical protein
MKDGLDVVTDVRSLINIQAITGLIDGKIWSNQRLNNSTKTDIVVNCNSISNTAIQIGFGNVNIYVPALIIASGNGGTQQYPDYAKMNTICKAVTPYLDTQFKATFRTEIEESGNVYQDTDGTWFINIGFKYYSMQTNYKNI